MQCPLSKKSTPTNHPFFHCGLISISNSEVVLYELTKVLKHQVMPRQSQHSYNAYVASGDLKIATQTVNLDLISLGDNLGSRIEVFR